MREITEKEMVMFNILKNNPKARNNNYEAVREWYRQVYGINLPSLNGCAEEYGTVERWIRQLKSLYPKELTDPNERQIKSEMESKFKEAALDKNKPIKRKENEQTSLLIGGSNLKEWW